MLMSSLYIEKRAREDCDNASKINDCGHQVNCYAQ